MIDEKIIIALEDYIKDNEFEYFHSNMTKEYLIRKSLDIINRQKSEIERLNKFIESQNELISKLALAGKNARTEAYKEFAEKVSEEIKKAYDNNSAVLREHYKKHKDNPDFEFVAAINGKMNTLRGLDDFIDNLLKEVVGEKE